MASENAPSLSASQKQESPQTASAPGSRSVWDKFQPIFFNPTLKVTALRILLLSSFVTCALGGLWFYRLFEDNPGRSILYMVVLCVSFIHHLISAFKFAFFLRVIDLVLTLAEVILLVFHANYFTFSRLSPMSIVAVIIAIWISIVCLLFLAVCRVVAVIRKKGTNLLKPFDLLEDSQRLKGLPVKTSPAAASILLGRSIWKPRFPGESTIVRLARGVFGGILILVMVVYGIVNVAIYPVRETAITPVKEYRSFSTPFDFPLEQPLWNLAFMKPVFDYEDYTNASTFRDAISVEPLWDRSNSDAPDCINDPTVTIATINKVTYQIIYSSCPPRQNTTGLLPVQIYLPDVLIKIDFAKLQGGNVTANTANLWSSAIQVMPGLTKNQDYVVRTTSPVTVLPGTNNLAELEMEVRQMFKHPTLSALGMFESTYSFASARLKAVIPDPLLRLSPDNDLITVNNDISTLRIFLPDAISDYKIVQDYREKAVLDGFAVIGGLWTFLCAIFAVIFGISMTRILFDTKPLSVFGLAQQFEREKIVEEYFATYPCIRTEIEYPHRDRGLVTLFRDHLIDVELFQAYIDDTEKERKNLENAESNDADPKSIDPTLRYRV